MELLYRQEHLACLFHDNSSRPAIELREIRPAHHFDEQSRQYKIVFLLEGELSYARDGSVQAQMEKGQMLFLPPDRRFSLRSQGQARILVIRLGPDIRFCECYLVESLLRQAGTIPPNGVAETPPETFLLHMNHAVKAFAYSLLPCMEAGLRCKYYFETKTKELFYLFRAFYNKQELALFFRDMLHSDAYFYYFVERNHRNHRTVAGLAVAMNMTVRTFEKHFKAVFSMTAYKWMTGLKAADIYNALCTGRTPLKELASQFGFSSKSSFSDFCRKNLGNTPGRIRENIRAGKNDEQKQQET